MGNETFNELIIRASHLELAGREDGLSEGSPDHRPNKRKPKIDVTVADQYIRYSNDLSLVNEGRVKTVSIFIMAPVWDGKSAVGWRQFFIDKHLAKT